MAQGHTRHDFEELVTEYVMSNPLESIWVGGETFRTPSDDLQFETPSNELRFELIMRLDPGVQDPEIEIPVDESRSVSIDGTPAQVTFRISDDRGQWSEYPKLYTDRRGDAQLSVDPLHQMIDEETVTIEELKTAVDTADDAHRIEYITLANASWEGPEANFADPESPLRLQQLRFDIGWSGPEHCEVGQFSSETRFDHINFLRTSAGEEIPVKFHPHLFTEQEGDDLPRGVWLHSSDFLANLDMVNKRHFPDQIDEVDLLELLEEPEPFDNPPMR